MDLDSLKYAELRRLAKEVGLKANMKVNRVYYGKAMQCCLPEACVMLLNGLYVFCMRECRFVKYVLIRTLY